MVNLRNSLIRPSRRTVLKGLGAGVAASTLGAPMVARAQSKGTIKIGFVTPATGPLAPFGETDGWTVDKVQEAAGRGTRDLRREAMTSRSWFVTDSPTRTARRKSPAT